MKEALGKLGLLLWKNWVILKRRKKRLLTDIIIPFFIGGFLLYLRYEVDISGKPEARYKPFDPNYIPPINNLKSRFGIDGWNRSEVVDLINSTLRGTGTLPPHFIRRNNMTYLMEQVEQSGKWRLIWSPDNDVVNDIMGKACTDMGVIGSPVRDAVTLEKTMIEPSKEFPQPREQILAGIVFPAAIHGKSALPTNMKISIRFPAELRFAKRPRVTMVPRNWLTSLIFPMLPTPGPREEHENEGGAPGYYREGFLGVQNAISSAILNYHAKLRAVPDFDIKLTRFPYPKYEIDPMIDVMQQFLPFLLVISFLFSVKRMTEKITTEKERKLKVIMNIMGLSDSIRWTSWFIYAMIFFCFLMTILIVVFKVPMVNERAVFPNSDWSCLALFFLCYASASTAFCFMMSTMFSKGYVVVDILQGVRTVIVNSPAVTLVSHFRLELLAGLASTVSGMMWFMLFVPFYVIHEKYMELSLLTKCLSSLLLNTGMGIGMHVILIYEGIGPGIQWDNIMKPPTPDDEMTVAISLAFIMLDCVLYMCLAFYIENVFPGEYGTPLPWYYPFQWSYWCRRPTTIIESPRPDLTDDKFDFPYEKETEKLPVGIKIKNLGKEYPGSSKPAVHNLSLSAYEGQITVLMGFNGAGKTTTLSILTGIYPPTSGTAMVAGHNIATNMKEVRKNMGFCPQYNVLFDELSVAEHIYFYGKLKGLDKEQIASETKKYIGLLNLQDKKYTLSEHLSGGMKRKLSVALAMLGDMKVLVLDEPTAGMDVGARRSLWDILIAEKKGRSILITTHYLDEANLLGDKVAIMSEGKLNCYGSTFFLKKNYSAGYHLNIIKKDDCNIAKITDIVRKNIADDIKAEDVGMELSYRLPDEYSGKFKELFRILENDKDELKIVGFGVTPTTLEDVFTRIATAAQKGESIPNCPTADEIKLRISSTQTVTGCPLLLKKIHAMFYKHMRHSLRSWKSIILLIILAVSGVCYAIFTIRLNSQLVNLPPRDLVLKDFPKAIATIMPGSACDDICKKMYDSYNDVLKRQSVNIVQLNGTSKMDDYFIAEATKDPYLYRTRHTLGTTFDVANKKTEINGWFNSFPYHTIPIVLSNIYNAIFNAFVGPDSSLTFTNYPLPYREQTKIDIQGMGIDKGFQIALFLAFTYIFISSTFILFPIQERESKSKLLQMVSGVSAMTFWSVALIWDLLIALGPNVAVLITFVAFQEEGYMEPESLGYSLLILTSFFFGCLPLIYLGSLFCSKPALGYILVSFFNIITGIFAMLLVMILRIPVLDLVDVAEALDWAFSLFPLYSFGRAFQNMNSVTARLELCKPIYDKFCVPNKNFKHICCKVPEQCPDGICVEWTENYLDWNEPGFGRYIAFFYITGAACFLLLLIIESGFFKIFRMRGQPPPHDGRHRDSDVIGERQKVRNLSESQRKHYSLVLDGLSKKYGKYVAVNNLFLAVKEGECFGLLGNNGAGKTTTLKILTGDEYPTSGDAYVKGLQLSNNMKKVRRLVGYCPQFDALVDDLTGREHLHLYCLIRGVPYEDINDVSRSLACDLLFEQFLDKKVKEYSGGNKRKLSTAIALIGNPPVVYLDEPTAGIDPVAKRHLWSVTSRLRSEGTTVILITHSMEECEALCTRLTIMVKGEFKCLGTAQYLKNKYCQGYSLVIKMKKRNKEREPDESGHYRVNTKEIEDFVKGNFPGAVLEDKHEELLEYRIPYAGITLSKIFGLIESAKESLHIEDYSVGQTTLEQVLLKFTDPETHTQ